jgi:UDP-GlcNAc:undecaprenyl-phosphate GlcNAc-1-phosphate transferase
VDTYEIVSAIGAILTGCFLATVLLTPVAMRIARSIGAVDQGGYRKISRGGIPVLGGLGIAVPLLTIGLLTGIAGHFVIRNWEWLWQHHRGSFNFLFTLAGSRSDCITLCVGGTLILALGLVDDTKGMRSRWKLLGQCAIALYVCLSGYVVTAITVPFFGAIDLGIGLGSVLTMLWIVGLINAFNLIDGIDGLATGIALISASAMVVLGVVQENMVVALAGSALAGSLLAFLFYNFPPAKVFLGDTGSMFIGFVLAMLALIGTQKSETAVIIFAPMFALSLPIFETLVSIVRRYVGGLPVFTGDSYHTHHRLLRKGYSQPGVVLTLYGVGFLLALAAVMSALIPKGSIWAWTPYALYIATLVNIAWLAGYLRPTNLHSVIERRQRNRLFHALVRYATLRVSAGMQRAEMTLLLELCRQELGLRYIEVSVPTNGQSIASPCESEGVTASESRDELNVKSLTKQDVRICYEFLRAADQVRRQDVSHCLAGIFDGIAIERILESNKDSNDAPDDASRSKLIRFKPGAKK